MATKVECKTCSKCLWGRTGGGDAPLCLLPPHPTPWSCRQSLPGETRQGWAKEQRGENSGEHNLEMRMYVYISIYM